ncbi:MAG: DUF86 domain-containing protein [Deltaproteobacteria bacterium]|nr:DUF86 domain-containing protein [Deltaproteobacteria bacterium]
MSSFLRNVFAHQYHNLNTQTMWSTLTNDIPTLKQFCLEILALFDNLSHDPQAHKPSSRGSRGWSNG